jgi:hypothetical protein
MSAATPGPRRTLDGPCSVSYEGESSTTVVGSSSVAPVQRKQRRLRDGQRGWTFGKAGMTEPGDDDRGYMEIAPR